MSTTQTASAHVCTVDPSHGPDAMAFAIFDGHRLMDLAAYFGCAPTACTPPRNWVGNIAPGTRCQDANAKYWNDGSVADFLQYINADGRTMGVAQRHEHWRIEAAGLWRVTVRQLVNGRVWECRTQGVTDDFGWLVEVPE